MNDDFWSSDSFGKLAVLSILVFFALLETLAGYLTNSKRRKGDWIEEAVSFISLSGFIKPTIVTIVLLIGSFLPPASSMLLLPYNFVLVLLCYLLIDDLLQYWYHRSAHEYPFLWKLHRTHHQAEEMGYLVSYRNAALYYLMMPNIWWMGIVTLLGGGKAVALGLILKQIVIISSHSRVKWDAPFYRYGILRPFILLIERIIITPSFHHTHHGQSRLDSASDPNGNFGNMFSLWDQLFGTAKFTRAYPSSYGLPNDTHDHWTAAYLYPLVKSKNCKSNLSKNYIIDDTATAAPIQIQLKKGERYLWCACGRSKNQPFCDGSHHGSKYKPILIEAEKDNLAKLCNCKITKIGPYCDNSHLELPAQESH